jgi:ADP-heptose:LPS heptosyltransferase
MIRRLIRKLRGNELERILRRAAARGARRCLVYWNRGLGDIPLGLYALFARLREALPRAEIAVLTRTDLAEAFELLGVERVIADRALVRDEHDGFRRACERTRTRAGEFDVVLEWPDPTEWVAWQLGRVVPRLAWKPEHDALWRRFGLDERRSYVAAHVSTETGQFYGYVKDWPIEHWRELFRALGTDAGVGCLLVGHAREQRFEEAGVIDLRGETSLAELLSILKNRCRVLVAPDGGVLPMAYYLDTAFALTVVSLWADPRQGVLKQAVASPNPLLRHVPLVGAGEDVRRIPVEEVLRHVRAGLADR